MPKKIAVKIPVASDPSNNPPIIQTDNFDNGPWTKIPWAVVFFVGLYQYFPAIRA